jgi:hypothetical protein
MIRGNLSNLRRGRGASSSRGVSSHGTGRSTRGGWYRGNNRVLKKTDDQASLGKLVAEFTSEDIASSPVVTSEARIINCEYAALYSLNDENPFKVIIPGRLQYAKEVRI